MSLTHHAETRLHQRAIPPVVVDMLMDYGSSLRSAGADRMFMDKAAMRRAKRSLKANDMAVLERWGKVYIVLSDDGAVVTAAHRTGRFRRP